MREIIDLKAELVPVMEVAMRFQSRHPTLFPIQDVIYSIQMAFDWFGDAAQTLSDLTAGSDDALLPGSLPEYPGAPGVPVGMEQIIYIRESLIAAIEHARRIRQDLLLPPQVAQSFDMGTNNLMQAKFSINVTKDYYDQTRSIPSGGASPYDTR